MKDIAVVGGKNASLGEMLKNLTPMGINVPDGFATTASAYWDFLDYNKFRTRLDDVLKKLDTATFSNLPAIGKECRSLILEGKFPEKLSDDLQHAYDSLIGVYGTELSLAVRSSATAEDLPRASFAGQLETYLNVKSFANLLVACHRCYASLFTDRAIKYRIDNGFDHMNVALSVGVQMMVRSDKACSGVMFTLDPDSGFENTVLISGGWGLGENVVQGNIITDEFLVFKPLLEKARQPVISHKLGSKEKTMIYSDKTAGNVKQPEDAVVNLDTPEDKRRSFVLSDPEIIQLAKWGVKIQEHYGRHMDIEWAKDGVTGELFVVQARPETIHSNKKNERFFIQYRIKERSRILCKGIGLGNKIVSGKARILHSPSEIGSLQQGEILVTVRTDPDWDPILKKAGAIITDQGGRTSHAAIVAREAGAVAIIGTSNGTKQIKDGQVVSVSAAEGDTGYVYDGEIEWEEKKISLDNIPVTHTKPMLILAHPDKAFRHSLLPNEGVGLMRMEFIINSIIQIHPMALHHFEKLKDDSVRKKIEELTFMYEDKAAYFIHTLAEATAIIASAFYPKDVIVRMSDFKSNEYANLIGGKDFEPKEENPMIGFRGASRYYHPLYRDGFEMECKAMKFLRDEMGLTNVKLMIPFCRTVEEAEKVIAIMEDQGLRRGVNGLELYVMIEIPSNALLADEFAKHFDGFSIGSNDLTQLTLGADRDSELLGEIFSPFDPAVMELIRMTLKKGKKAGVKTGLCGQAPSDYPEYARFLVENGIDSISFNQDAMLKGIERIAEAESLMFKPSVSKA